MGKVLNYSEFLLKKEEQPKDRNAILTVAVLPEAEAIIEQAGLESLFFHLNKESEQIFKKKPVDYKEPDDSFSDIYYDAKTQDAIYRVECKIFIETSSVSVETNLYKFRKFSKWKSRMALFFRK